MTMSRSSSSPDSFTARTSAVTTALAALIAGLGAHARWRLAGRPQPILNNGGNRGDGPPDMEEMWRDFNRRLSGLFGGKGGGPRPTGPNGGGNNFQPDMRNAGVGIGLIAGVVVLIWLGSGFFIVQEGQQAVVTSFGKYDHTANAGFTWRFPYPFQAHETVNVTQVRTVEVGRNSVAQSTGLRESSMLTQDENIVDIRFTVQYRLKDARAFLYENRDPEASVVQAAESAVREIVGRSQMDSVLYEQRDAIAIDLMKSLQTQLDRLNTGILVLNVNVGSVQAPEQVQAAFDDAFKANADRERFKNEGQAYANDVIPKAKGSAARLKEQAEGYRARVVAEAEGDAERFSQVLAEYQKAPGVTRDRLYTDAMRHVFSNVTKVMVDTKSNSNLLYLPLDKLIAQTAGTTVPAATAPAAPAAETLPSTMGGNTIDSRSRDNARSRDRESR
jgi:membrane protease subunit HflK